MSEKKASYSCFLETCDSKYWNADERREHCIKSHGFPANFKFDSRNQKKAKRDQQKKSSKQQSNKNRANKTGSHHENVEMMDQDDVKASQQPLSAKGISTNTFFLVLPESTLCTLYLIVLEKSIFCSNTVVNGFFGKKSVAIKISR